MRAAGQEPSASATDASTSSTGATSVTSSTGSSSGSGVTLPMAEACANWGYSEEE
jgi:hypothetical protein